MNATVDSEIPKDELRHYARGCSLGLYRLSIFPKETAREEPALLPCPCPPLHCMQRRIRLVTMVPLSGEVERGEMTRQEVQSQLRTNPQAWPNHLEED